MASWSEGTAWWGTVGTVGTRTKDTVGKRRLPTVSFVVRLEHDDRYEVRTCRHVQVDETGGQLAKAKSSKATLSGKGLGSRRL